MYREVVSFDQGQVDFVLIYYFDFVKVVKIF